MMKSLRDLLNNRTFNSPLLRGVTASQVITSAEKVLTKIFGEEIKNHAAPGYFKNNTLSIACLSTTVAQEIKLNEQKIVAEINNEVKGANLQKIKFLT